MAIPDARWHEVSASAFEHERQAIAWLRDRLPDHEPWRAWANFEFVAHDGSHNEVDLLVVGRTGVFLIEIKSHPGVVSGDQRLLEVRDPASPDRSRQLEHPVHLANRKAKRLKSILERTSALGGGPHRVPFIQPVVFMAEATRIEVDGPAAHWLFMRDLDGDAGGPVTAATTPDDPDAASAPHHPGIIAALTGTLSPRPAVRHLIDKPTAKALDRALTEAGITASPRRRSRTVGDWTLGEKIDEGPTWQDYRARQTTSPEFTARIRRYIVDESAAVDLGKQPVQRVSAARRPGREAVGSVRGEVVGYSSSSGEVVP